MRLVTITALLAMSLWAVGCGPQKPKDTGVQIPPQTPETTGEMPGDTLAPGSPSDGVMVPPPPPVGIDAGSYVVKAGDTLYNIAKTHLGSGKRWKEIADLNGITDPSKQVKIGMTLKLPAK